MKKYLIIAIFFALAFTYHIAHADCTGPISVIGPNGQTLQGNISGNAITINYPGFGILRGYVSMGHFSAENDYTSLHGNINPSSCTQASLGLQLPSSPTSSTTSNGYNSEIWYKNYLACVNIPHAGLDYSSNPNGTCTCWSGHSFNSTRTSCISNSLPTPDISCLENYSPDSFFNLNKNQCECLPGYALEFDSSTKDVSCRLTSTQAITTAPPNISTTTLPNQPPQPILKKVYVPTSPTQEPILQPNENTQAEITPSTSPSPEPGFFQRIFGFFKKLKFW